MELPNGTPRTATQPAQLTGAAAEKVVLHLMAEGMVKSPILAYSKIVEVKME